MSFVSTRMQWPNIHITNLDLSWFIPCRQNGFPPHFVLIQLWPLPLTIHWSVWLWSWHVFFIVVFVKVCQRTKWSRQRRPTTCVRYCSTLPARYQLTSTPRRRSTSWPPPASGCWAKGNQLHLMAPRILYIRMTKWRCLRLSQCAVWKYSPYWKCNNEWW